jgi:asparagine synthase (glutamine-hydrolysing)
MCGLTGIISLNGRSINKEQLIKMNQALSHRGPDSDGFWYNDDCTVGFGHRRLSIIDLSDDGRQPFIYQNRYVIVFNGEIYNYIELRN